MSMVLLVACQLANVPIGRLSRIFTACLCRIAPRVKPNYVHNHIDGLLQKPQSSSPLNIKKYAKMVQKMNTLPAITSAIDPYCICEE